MCVGRGAYGPGVTRAHRDDGRAGGGPGEVMRDPCSQDRPEDQHSTARWRAEASEVPHDLPPPPPRPPDAKASRPGAPRTPEPPGPPRPARPLPPPPGRQRAAATAPA